MKTSKDSRSALGNVALAALLALTVVGVPLHLYIRFHVARAERMAATLFGQLGSTEAASLPAGPGSRVYLDSIEIGVVRTITGIRLPDVRGDSIFVVRAVLSSTAMEKLSSPSDSFVAQLERRRNWNGPIAVRISRYSETDTRAVMGRVVFEGTRLEILLREIKTVQ